jgi:hypothetical protein
MNPFRPNAPLVYDARCDRADRGDEMFYRKNMGSKESWALIGFCPACAMAGRKSLEGLP